MTGRQTRQSARLSLATTTATAATAGRKPKPKPKPVVEPIVVNKTRFRNSKPATIASDTESDSDDDDADEEEDDDNIENQLPTNTTNRRVAAQSRKAPAPVPAAAKAVPKAAKMPAAAKRKSAEQAQPTQTASASESEATDTECNDNRPPRRDHSDPTPPKLARFAGAGSGQQKLEPTALLDKLTLTSPKHVRKPPVPIERTSPPAEAEAEAAAGRSKYQNARITLNSAETYSLPGRERELAELTEFLAAGLRDQRSASMYISGPPGTGKTASLSKLLNASEFTERFQRVYVNCTSIASIGSIYKKVCAELGLRVGTEKDCLLAIERHLAAKHRTILMVLDEVDQLVGKKQSVLYTIFEWPAKPASNLLLIGIANSLDLTDRCLSRLHAKCELKPRLMHFAPYSKEQIVGIFKARLAEAGVLEIFPPVTLQLLAAKVASISGDVRKALDIGRRVIEMAEEQRRGAKKVDLAELGIGELEPATAAPAAAAPAAAPEKVEIKQVMQVLNQVYGTAQTLGDDLDDTFPLQQKILVCTVLLILRCDKNKDITVGRLHGVYAKVCASRNIAAVGRSEFSGLCELVETRGIVRMIKNKEPRMCKVQMQWDEAEVTAALQDKQMIASILADAAAVRGK